MSTGGVRRFNRNLRFGFGVTGVTKADCSSAGSVARTVAGHLMPINSSLDSVSRGMRISQLLGVALDTFFHLWETLQKSSSAQMTGPSSPLLLLKEENSQDQWARALLVESA